MSSTKPFAYYNKELQLYLREYAPPTLEELESYSQETLNGKYFQ